MSPPAPAPVVPARPAPAVVGCVVSYCSMERHFLEHLLRETSKFSEHTVVVYADKLYDGTPETHDDLVRVKELFQDVTFVQYRIDPVDELIDAPELRNRQAYWPNRARWEGLAALNPSCQYVLFMDADEVPEGDRVAAFIKRALAPRPDHTTPGLKFANWWYMREPTLRYRGIEDSIPLVPRFRVATRDAVLLCEDERNDLAAPPVSRSVTDGSPSPMFHHYSWVRTPEDLVKKVQVWSHRRDRDWVSAVRQELSRPIVPGHVDVIFGRNYEQVPNAFGIVIK
jgi:hypothetical protein